MVSFLLYEVKIHLQGTFKHVFNLNMHQDMSQSQMNWSIPIPELEQNANERFLTRGI